MLKSNPLKRSRESSPDVFSHPKISKSASSIDAHTLTSSANSVEENEDRDTFANNKFNIVDCLKSIHISLKDLSQTIKEDRQQPILDARIAEFEAKIATLEAKVAQMDAQSERLSNLEAQCTQATEKVHHILQTMTQTLLGLLRTNPAHPAYADSDITMRDLSRAVSQESSDSASSDRVNCGAIRL